MLVASYLIIVRQYAARSSNWDIWNSHV